MPPCMRRAHSPLIRVPLSTSFSACAVSKGKGYGRGLGAKHAEQRHLAGLGESTHPWCPCFVWRERGLEGPQPPRRSSEHTQAWLKRAGLLLTHTWPVLFGLVGSHV